MKVNAVQKVLHVLVVLSLTGVVEGAECPSRVALPPPPQKLLDASR